MLREVLRLLLDLIALTAGSDLWQVTALELTVTSAVAAAQRASGFILILCLPFFN